MSPGNTLTCMKEVLKLKLVVCRASQLDHFLDFITSEHIIQELPFGERTLILSSEKKITVPKVVRKVIPERVIQQYNLFCTETGFAPMGRSTLHNILDVCSASVRNSLQGLDYFTAQGTQAFDDLESVVDKLGEDCGMSSSSVKEKKEQLKEGKRYLKSDYKVPLLSLLSLLLSLLLLLIECASSVLITIQRYELLIKTWK